MLAKAELTYDFSIYGIHCSLCLKKLKALPEVIPGLKGVVIDMSKQTIKAEAEENFEPTKFIAKIQELGFEAKELQADEDQEASVKKSRNSLLAKVGIAGALAGNIMLLSFAVYLGAPAEFSKVFNWVSGLLFSPVLFYASTPFYQSSWSAVKNKKPSIDLPLTLAITLGSILSYLNLFQGSDSVYFDSLATLVFLLLGSRYIVQRLQVKYLAPMTLQDIFPVHKFTKISENEKIEVLGNEVSPGDYIQLKMGQTVPADAKLVSETAFFDNALITGESDSVLLNQWSEVYAGTQCMSDLVVIEISKKQKDSRIGSILNKLNTTLNKDSSIIQLTDSFANYFTIGIFGIGILFFVFYSFISLEEAINRVLALFVIACPCALAVTTPLVLRLSSKQALKNNFLVKKIDVFEKLTRCEAVVFDKTGTLTSGKARGGFWIPRHPNHLESDIIFSLENKSQHPVAKAILRSLDSREVNEIDLKNYQENIGVGVSGIHSGDKYSIQKSEDGVGFYKNEKLIISFENLNTLRPEVAIELEALREQGLETYLLTGDSFKNTERVIRPAGFPKENVFSNLNPEEKENFIRDLSAKKKIVYVGDGMNDVLAMSQGLVGVSMQQSVDAAFATSSVHILKDGIEGLSQLYSQAKRTVKSIKVLLTLSIIYNSIFGVLALSGFITPLVAAILMPISSVSLAFAGMFLNRRKAL